MKIKFPIVYVEYLDHSWLDGKNKKDINKAKAPIVKEVGFLIGVDENGIKFCKTIIQNREPKNNSIDLDEATIILNSDIIKIIQVKDI